ncbi:MAG: urease accessory protein UreD [Pseudomonadota bacterium]
MFDIMPPIQHQRAKGAARVSVSRAGLQDLYQAGAAKAMLPRVHGPAPEVVFLNTSGGLTGGDSLHFGVEVGAGADLVATTQTAERAYASVSGAATVDIRLDVEAGGRLDWLPQETILFDTASLCRQTVAQLAGDASALMVEMVVLGRAAMGETIKTLHLKDTREVWRDGRRLWHDPLSLTPATLGSQSALLGEARAVATLAFFAPGAEDALGPLRQCLADSEIRAEASAWDGRLILRAAASDGWPLRKLIARCLETLRQRPLPRVWQI